MEFKATELIILNENQQWEIGDALIEDCGIPSSHGVNDNSQAIIYQIKEELKDNGVIKEIAYLKRLRINSYNFPNNRRSLKISWSVHEIAGTPNMLDEIKRMAGNRRITVELAKDLKGIIEREQAEEERRRLEAARPKPIPQNAPDFEVLIAAISNTQDLNFQTFDQSMINRLREACLKLAELIDSQLAKETNVHVLKK